VLRQLPLHLAHDALEAMGGSCRRSLVVEVACDANRPMGFGGGRDGEVWMTAEEYRVLSAWYGTPSFKKWTREVFPCDHYCI
jgi:hypothetical protein